MVSKYTASFVIPLMLYRTTLHFPRRRDFQSRPQVRRQGQGLEDVVRLPPSVEAARRAVQEDDRQRGERREAQRGSLEYYGRHVEANSYAGRSRS